MNLKVFREKDTPEQVILVGAHGTFLMHRYRLQYTIYLFDMGTFYAEVWLYSKTKKVIIARGFSKLIWLNPYLQSISLIQLGLDSSILGEETFFK